MEKKNNLFFCIGMDELGNKVSADLSELPHLVIGGGDTKKRMLYLEGILDDLERDASCDFVMLDPLNLLHKNSNFRNKTDVFNCKADLSAVCKEMSVRYEYFANVNVSCINEYNQICEKLEIIRPIAVIIPELSALINEKGILEDIISICRIGKPVGIHLIVSDSDWTSNIIEVVKINIVSRLSFGVATSQESLAVLDFEGAEYLLDGELLFESMENVSPIKYTVNPVWKH